MDIAKIVKWYLGQPFAWAGGVDFNPVIEGPCYAVGCSVAFTLVSVHPRAEEKPRGSWMPWAFSAMGKGMPNVELLLRTFIGFPRVTLEMPPDAVDFLKALAGVKRGKGRPYRYPVVTVDGYAPVKTNPPQLGALMELDGNLGEFQGDIFMNAGLLGEIAKGTGGTFDWWDNHRCSVFRHQTEVEELKVATILAPVTWSPLARRADQSPVTETQQEAVGELAGQGTFDELLKREEEPTETDESKPPRRKRKAADTHPN